MSCPIEWLKENACKVLGRDGNDRTEDFISLLKSACDDNNKKMRIRSDIPTYQRCQAYKANGEQCTRRRRDDCELCGTHMKGTPHGRLNLPEGGQSKTKRYLTCVKEVNGINYHVDTQTNSVYLTADILRGNREPRVIGVYKGGSRNSSIDYSPACEREKCSYDIEN